MMKLLALCFALYTIESVQGQFPISNAGPSIKTSNNMGNNDGGDVGLKSKLIHSERRIEWEKSDRNAIKQHRSLDATPSCDDHPQGWHDADGSEYNCEWYAQKQNCQYYGDGYANLDYTANMACCSCGGGVEISHALPSDPTSGVNGDPHFTTWLGEKYDFHGICDLVLLQNQKFNGIGMDIHIRTKKTRMWSYASSGVIRIGEDTLEVVGGKSENGYWINKVQGDEILEDESILPVTIGGFPIKFTRLSDVARQFTIELGSAEQINIKTWNAMVSINIKGGKKEDFGNSLGLMGTFDHGLLIGRDNQTIFENRYQFGMEWQVKEYEPKLFHNVEGPQAPSKCDIPSRSEMRRRLGEVQISKSDAEIACKDVHIENFDLCVFDAIATNNLNVAHSY